MAGKGPSYAYNNNMRRFVPLYIEAEKNNLLSYLAYYILRYS